MLTDSDFTRLMKQGDAALRELDRIDCADSLSSFIRLGWSQLEPHTLYKHGWHIDAISDHLQAVSDGYITRLLINVPPGSLKPVHIDEPVLTKRGRVPLGDVVVGDMVLTHKGRFRKVIAVQDNGELSTLRLKTFSGREIVAALDHPILTTRGWTQAKNIVLGDVLGAVTPSEDEFSDLISPEEARLMGYLVGDGSVTNSPSFTNGDLEVIEDFERCASTLGWQVRRRDRNSPSMRKRNADVLGISGALPWLEKHGLRGADSYTKRIPLAVLQSSNRIIANFIGAYWSCDGTVHVRHQRARGDRHIASATTVGRKLSGDLQHALLRLGISARVRKHSVKLHSKKQPGGIYTSYNIISSTHEEAVKFATLPGLMGRKSSKLSVLVAQRFRQGPLVEDEVVAIEPAGTLPCRCLSVDEDHSFTASDLAVHNSLSTSVFFPSWEWGPGGKPGLRYIGTSYSERYAVRDNARMRNLIQSNWYQDRWGDQVRLTKFGERKFENTAYGFREAIPFASLTAGRADRLIIDDPHSTESAESDADRETTIRIFLESVPTRLNDPEKSAIIIIMQRLHSEDVSGMALARDLGYTHLSLPMEYDSSRHCVTYYPGTNAVLFEDPRTEDGELLFPDRFPKSVVDSYRTTMGPFAFAGQMQQIPVPRGGGIFPLEWWQMWENPEDSEDLRFKRFPECEFIVASLDSAFGEKEENDYSALTIWGVFKDPIPKIGGAKSSRRSQQDFGRPKLILMHAFQARLPLHELVERVAQVCGRKRFNVDLLLIEAKASGISVAQEMRRLYGGERFGIKLIDPGRQDKVARAYSVQHIFADEMVYAPQREWASMVMDQMGAFPKTAHKDLTDSATQAVRYLRDIGLLLHGDEVSRAKDDAMAYKGSSGSKPLYPA